MHRRKKNKHMSGNPQVFLYILSFSLSLCSHQLQSTQYNNSSSSNNCRASIFSRLQSSSTSNIFVLFFFFFFFFFLLILIDPSCASYVLFLAPRPVQLAVSVAQASYSQRTSYSSVSSQLLSQGHIGLIFFHFLVRKIRQSKRARYIARSTQRLI